MTARCIEEPYKMFALKARALGMLRAAHMHITRTANSRLKTPPALFLKSVIPEHPEIYEA